MTQSEVLAIRYATTITGLAIYLYNKRKLYGGWPIMQPMHIPQLVDRQLQRVIGSYKERERVHELCITKKNLMKYF